MRFLKIFAYIIIVVVLQRVVFARLAFWGIVPDFILVSVVCFSMMEARTPATLFSAALGFFMDIFYFGVYIHTIKYVLVSSISNTLKEELKEGDLSFNAFLVSIFTLLILCFEALVYHFVLGRDFSLYAFVLRSFLQVVFNLLALAIIFPLLKKVNHAG